MDVSSSGFFCKGCVFFCLLLLKQSDVLSACLPKTIPVVYWYCTLASITVDWELFT